MKRIDIAPREGWQSKVAEQGLVWHTVDNKPYWNEGAFYEFSASQAENIETASNELYQMFLAAGEHVINNGLLGKFGIPAEFHGYIEDQWNSEPPALNYGRFDLGYNGTNEPKLFEFNADTPTSLVEASVIQHYWKEEVFPGSDVGQFNNIHEAFVEKWRDIASHLTGRDVHFTYFDEVTGEDIMTVTYLRETAKEAGLNTLPIEISQIGWDGFNFTDLANFPIRNLYKLYPWEWLVNEAFGQNVLKSGTTWIEPIWKMIWSNKAILPVLWQLFKGHPNLLEAHFHEPTDRASWVKKPFLSREGANIEIVHQNSVLASTDGVYGEEGFIYQDMFNLPAYGGVNFPIIGSWIVDGECVGMGIREGGLITNNTSRFVPHVVR